MGIPLLAGREFTVADRQGSTPVAIIDELLAKRYFPHGSAIGARMDIAGDTAGIRIVGVVRQPRLYGLQADDRPQVYRPHAHAAYRAMTMAVRVAGDPAAMAPVVRAAIHELDREQPIALLQPMSTVVDQALAERRLVMVLIAAFATAAVLLASLGVYGVTANAVTQRTRELGIRVALGATSRQVVWLVLRRPMRLIAGGLVVGLAGALVATRLARGLLFGVSPTDPAVLGTVALVLTAVALLAGWLPARRATRVDPALALRSD
jgi:predicted permease